MKKLFPFCCLFVLTIQLFAQSKVDSAFIKPMVLKDSIIADSTLKIDSLPAAPIVVSLLDIYKKELQFALNENVFLNAKAIPIAGNSKEMPNNSADFIFYILLINVLLLGLLRLFYMRYFNNLFRVFFNTSLRQSQLTDQLLQSKLASMLFNMFFTVTGGLYIYLLLLHYQWISADNKLFFISACVIILAIIYAIKFITLKFTGWLTGNKDIANTYLFIIFLINKIISVLLLPFVIVMAFASTEIKIAAVVVSTLLVILMFLLRFIRSFGLLQHRIKVSWFHFLIFIVGIELLPILLIYKGLVIFLNKNS